MNRAALLLIVCFSLLSAQIEVGDKAPTFFLPKQTGGSFYLSKIVGPKAKPKKRTPVVLSFFQTTCVPCKAEIAEFEKLQEQFPRIPIYLIDLNEKPQLVDQYIAEFDLKLPMLLDRYGVTGKKYGVVDENKLAHLPNSFILALDGTVYYHHQGFKPGDEAIYREKLTDMDQALTAWQDSLVKAEQAEALAAAAAAPKSGIKQSGKLAVGDKAPTFFLPRQKGGSFYLSRTVGPKAKAANKRPVVISFFQTTCIPCKAEITELEKLQEEFPGITIFLVDLNEPAELVAEYIERFDLKLEMLLDRYGAVGKKYGVVDAQGLAHLPNSFVVSPDGTLYYHHTGFKPGDEEVYRQKFIELTSSGSQ